jgi:hypothetical protein
VRLGTATGLALAATYLTKISNLPLLAVSGAVVLFKISRLAKAGKLRAAFPALAALALCAGLPIGGWLAWTKCHFGDFTGTAAKIQFLGWTHKSFGEWWHHPIFTPHGLWTFVSGLLATFWQGEFLWHRQPLASPVVDAIYAISSIGFVGVAVAPCFPAPRRDRTATAGAVVRILVFSGGGGVSGVPVHHLRFPGLLLSVARPSVFHLRPVDARRVDSLFAALPLRTGLRAWAGEK